MPSTTPIGAGSVTLTYNGVTSEPEPVHISSSGFGIFTLNEGGSGPAVVTDANYSPITLTHAAQPGQTLILWGTGLGPVHSGDTLPPAVGDLSTPVTVYVGTQKADVSYHGRSSCCAGLDQINFVVPPTAGGCYVPIAVQTANTPSNFGTISVSGSGNVCSDRNGFSESQLAQVTSGKNIRLASLSLVRSTQTINLPPPFPSGTTIIDNGAAEFVEYTADQLLRSLGPFQTHASPNGCIVYSIDANTQSVSDPIQGKGLDAGPSIGITGPKGAKQLIPDNGLPGYYSGAVGNSRNGGNLYLHPGSYTFTGPGGRDVGAFHGQLQVPPQITWTNAGSVTTINRSQGATITWTGAAPDGFVYISGYSVAGATSPQTTSNASPAALFFCTANAADGKFTIPPVVLLALPPSGTVLDAPIPLGGMALVSAGAPVSFSAPGIDIGFAAATSAVSQPTAFQ
jgi:hypothetical protein